MTASVHNWLPLIEPELPGAGVSDVQRGIRDAIIEFCTKTEWWRANLAEIALEADTAAYVLVPPAEAAVVNALHVSIEGRDLRLKDVEWLDRALPGWSRSDAVTDRNPLYWFRPSPTQIQVVRVPNQEAEDALAKILVRAALKPSDTTLVIDDRLWTDARYAIRRCALGILLDTAKPWGDRRRAAEERTKFVDDVAEFRWRAETGDGRGIVLAEAGSWDTGGYRPF